MLPFVVGLVGALFLGWWVFPQLLFSQKLQPIEFSHFAHTETAGMACEDCHYFRPDGSFSGLPDNAKCAECHSEATGSNKAIDQFVTEYLGKGKEVDWRVVQYQPDNALFTHAAHQGFACTQCHPDVGKSKTSPVVYENRLTGYSAYTMKMQACERCHAELGVSNACHVCHK